MKVFLDENFLIKEIVDNNIDVIVKGSTNYDEIKIYIPTSLKEQYTTIYPTYSVKRADGREIGVYNTLSTTDLSETGYYGWKGHFQPRDIAVVGALQVTFAFNMTKDSLYQTKTIQMITTKVSNAVYVDNEILVIGEGTVESMVDTMNDMKGEMAQLEDTVEDAAETAQEAAGAVADKISKNDAAVVYKVSTAITALEGTLLNQLKAGDIVVTSTIPNNAYVVTNIAVLDNENMGVYLYATDGNTIYKYWYLKSQSGTNWHGCNSLAINVRYSSTDKLNADYIQDGTTNKVFTGTEKTKLSGIEAGAEVNVIEGVKVNGTAQTPDANKIISLTIPTQASDVNALPNSTKYCASCALEINSSTYVMSLQLKDQNGNNLGTAKTIDLPLETMVVSGSYDSATKKVVLTLQNGQTIEFSVADLVSGLQTEITAQNKLSSDLVDDTNQTNKFVTSDFITKVNAILKYQSEQYGVIAEVINAEEYFSAPTAEISHLTANEITLGFQSGQDLETLLNTEDNKSLYNLGAFDSVSESGGITTITRQTGYLILNKLYWEYNSSFGCWYSNVQSITSFPNDCESVASNYIATQKAYTDLQNGELTTSKYTFSSNNHIIIKDVSTNYPKGLLQYKLANSYTEQVIANRPLNTLDQKGSQWLRSEWEKGLNIWDEQWESGVWSINVGSLVQKVTNSDYIRSKNYIKLLPNTTYSCKFKTNYDTIVLLDSDYAVISIVYASNGGARTFTTPSNCNYMVFYSYGTTYNNDFMLNEGDHAYPYQPYYGGIVHQKQIDELEQYKASKESILDKMSYDAATDTLTIQTGDSSNKAEITLNTDNELVLKSYSSDDSATTVSLDEDKIVLKYQTDWEEDNITHTLKLDRNGLTYDNSPLGAYYIHNIHLTCSNSEVSGLNFKLIRRTNTPLTLADLKEEVVSKLKALDVMVEINNGNGIVFYSPIEDMSFYDSSETSMAFNVVCNVQLNDKTLSYDGLDVAVAEVISVDDTVREL